MSKSRLEDTLLFQIRVVCLPEPEREYRFHPNRRWRFDFAWPDKMLAVEVQGGIYVRGAHSRGTGLERDYSKYNEAILLEWRVLQVSGKMIKNGEAVKLIERAFLLKAGT